MPTLDRAILLPIAAAGLLALLFAVFLIFWVLRQPEGNDRMKEIAKAIQEGAQAYLNRQYTIIAGIGAVIFLFLTFTLGWKTGVLFLIGAVLSGAAGYVGMNISVRSNLRTAEAARGGVNPALQLAFRGGAVTGFFVVGFGLIGVALAYGLFQDFNALVGLRLRRVADLRLRPPRWWHLHQGRGRRRRPGRQARSRHSGRRSAQPCGHRRQRR